MDINSPRGPEEIIVLPRLKKHLDWQDIGSWRSSVRKNVITISLSTMINFTILRALADEFHTEDLRIEPCEVGYYGSLSPATLEIVDWA